MLIQQPPDMVDSDKTNESLPQRRAARLNGSSDELTARELEVMYMLCRGLTNLQIAEVLCISSHTVHKHLQSCFAKLDVHTRIAAVQAFLNLVPLSNGDITTAALDTDH